MRSLGPPNALASELRPIAESSKHSMNLMGGSQRIWKQGVSLQRLRCAHLPTANCDPLSRSMGEQAKLPQRPGGSRRRLLTRLGEFARGEGGAQEG